MRALCLAGAFALVAAGVGAQEEPLVLPRQMGAINDYAAVVGAGREALQQQIDAIKKNFDVQIVLLATVFDPFDDAPRFSQKIWEAWKLGERTALLLFTKEHPERWVYELKLSDDLRATLRAEHLERLRQGLNPHLERKRIKTAMEEAVTALQAMLDGSYGQPPPAPRWEFDFHWVWIALGGLLLVGLIFLARRFLKNLCPRCGARLRAYRSYDSRGGGRAQYRSCPRCGYARLR